MKGFEIFDNADSHVFVVDSPMGSGKTTKFIEYINNMPNDQKVIFITPYLSECQRVIDNCKKRNFVQPDVRAGRGRKSAHFLDLIQQEANIVSTHSLFSNISEEVVWALQSSNYTLILDETFDVVDKFDLFPEIRSDVNKDVITRGDIDILLDKEFISVEDDFRIIWNDDKYNLKKYEQLIRLANRGLLYLVNNSLLLWSFPIEVFQEGIFDKIFILTFQFESQIQHYYYSYFGLKYTKYWIDPTNSYQLNKTVDNNPHEKLWIESIKSLITIEDSSKLNKIGGYFRDVDTRVVKTALSKSWYLRNPKLHKKLSNNATNWLRNYSNKNSSNDIMWTTFVEFQKTVSTKGLSLKHFVPINARATNEYGNKFALVYLVNRYLNPFYQQFFQKREVIVDQDQYALNEMMQWIWRSRIRNYKPIQLYVPSQRMRTLLENYLNGKEMKI